MYTKQIARLQYITNDFSSDSPLEQTRKVLEGGCKWIQLRMKDSSKEEILKTGKQIKQICLKHDAIFIMNDNPHLAKELNAEGVHLGKNDMSPIEARKILGEKAIIGGTANNIEDIRNLHIQRVDYIGLGPYRFTNTKKNLSACLGIQGYKDIINLCKQENINIPILAIGGIVIEDIKELLDSEIYGIALSSALSNQQDIRVSTNKYIKACMG